MTASSSSPTLGVGIVGWGFIGKVHAFAHRSVPLFYDPLPFQARLVGVCTASAASGEKAIQQAGFEFATRDFDALLARPDIQIIHVCTPNDVHATQVAAALRAGKHIYCDKPLTRTVAEADEVFHLAEKSPADLVQRMTFNCRFAPATLRARQLIEQGFLGELYHFRGAYLHAGYLDPKRPRTWRLQMARSGGGAIMDLGVHIYDLLRWLLLPVVGEMQVTSATLTTRIPQRPDPQTGVPEPVDVDDIALVQMQAGPAHGVIEASRLATGVQDELRFEIHGSRGALSFNLMEPNFLTIYDATQPEGALGANRGPQQIESVARYPKPYSLGATKNTLGWPQLHVACLHEFLSSVGGIETNGAGATFADGRAANQWVADAQHAAGITVS